MNNLEIFKNADFSQIRVALLNDKPMLNIYDICFNLGYTKEAKGKTYLFKERVENICSTLDIEGLYVTYNDNITGLSPTDRTIEITKDIDFENTWITEENFYDLCLESKAKNARGFRKWVTSEVLPSIRKNGAYLTDSKIEEVLTDPDTIIKLATQLKKERVEKKQLQLINKQKDQLIGELKPKADYMDSILKNKGLVTITQIAKDYGMSGTKMNDLLHDLDVQFKQSGQWLLYSKYHDKGYTHSETIPITHSDGRADVKMNTKWTQKGRLFLYDLLKMNEILPVIEQREDKTKKQGRLKNEQLNKN